MRPLIIDVENSFFDLASGRLDREVRHLLGMLLGTGRPATNAPFVLLSLAAPSELPARRESLARIVHDEGLPEVASSIAERVLVLAAPSRAGNGYRERYRDALLTAAEYLGISGHCHGAIYLSGHSTHLEIARDMAMLPYELRAPRSKSDAEAAGIDNDIARDLAELVRFQPCEKKRALAPGRFATAVNKDLLRAKTGDPRIQALLEQVSADRLRNSLQQLTAWGTRWTFANHIDQVTSQIADAFRAAGYAGDSVGFQPFRITGSQREHRNVLCRSQANRPSVLVCAHYDSTSTNPGVSAPGCDDNASGIATMLEAARILREVPLGLGVIYAAFGGEEQGLFGSRACADIASRDDWDIRLVINLDMVGYRDPARPKLITVEFDQGNTTGTNDAAAKEFGLQMAQIVETYTSPEVEHTDIWNSDYMPFEKKGFPCIGLYDGAADAPFYHTVQDTLDKVDVARLSDVTKVLVATVATIAEV